MNRPAGCGGEGATGRTSAPICHDETRGCAHERKVGSGQEGPRRGDALAPYRADQGNAVAQEYIGYLYQNGFGAQQDYAEAMRWHRMAADQRNIRGQNNVGYLYQSGVGVKQDYTEAMRWHRMAADQGNAWAQNQLGYLYQNGLGVPRDLEQARQWWRNGAAGGNEDAKKALAQYGD